MTDSSLAVKITFVLVQQSIPEAGFTVQYNGFRSRWGNFLSQVFKVKSHDILQTVFNIRASAFSNAADWSQGVMLHSHQASAAALPLALTLGMGLGSIFQRQDQRQPVWIFPLRNSKTLSERQRWRCRWRLVWMELKEGKGVSAGWTWALLTFSRLNVHHHWNV